jgi:DNA-binding Lrp family transcriptional regulator
MALVLVNCEFDQVGSIARTVKEIRGVLEAHTTTGIYDLILKVEAEDESKFQELIMKIKSINGVTSTVENIIYTAARTA